jgi:hypothetical protein
MASSNEWFESVAEAQRRARRRLPKSVYGALVAGSERGVTVNDNVNAFSEIGFWPQIANLPRTRDQATLIAVRAPARLAITDRALSAPPTTANAPAWRSRVPAPPDVAAHTPHRSPDAPPRRRAAPFRLRRPVPLAGARGMRRCTRRGACRYRTCVQMRMRRYSRVPVAASSAPRRTRNEALHPPCRVQVTNLRADADALLLARVGFGAVRGQAHAE